MTEQERAFNLPILEEIATYTLSELDSGAKKHIKKSEEGIYKIYVPDNFKMKMKYIPEPKYPIKNVEELWEKWAKICKYPGYEDGLLYIGKSTDLYGRIGELIKMSKNLPSGHSGGCDISQLENNNQLIVKIYKCQNSDKRKKDELDTYCIRHGDELPWANREKGCQKSKIQIPTSSFKETKKELVFPTNYIELHKFLIKIGELGEKYVYEQERKRLLKINSTFADMVDSTPANNPQNGFDILSYTETGNKIFIEVKTTTDSANTPFYMSAHELDIAKKLWQSGANYQIHRVYNIMDEDDSKIGYIIYDSLEKLDFIENSYKVIPK